MHSKLKHFKLCYRFNLWHQWRLDQALQICDNRESVPCIRRHENISARHIPSKKPSRSRSGFITKWRGILQGMPQVSVFLDCSAVSSMLDCMALNEKLNHDLRHITTGRDWKVQMSMIWGASIYWDHFTSIPCRFILTLVLVSDSRLNCNSLDYLKNTCML